MTELRLEPLTLPGVRLGPENPLPIFRDAQPHRAIPVHDTVPPEKRDLFGWETGFRVLPYRLQDNYTGLARVHDVDWGNAWQNVGHPWRVTSSGYKG